MKNECQMRHQYASKEIRVLNHSRGISTVSRKWSTKMGNFHLGIVKIQGPCFICFSRDLCNWVHEKQIFTQLYNKCICYFFKDWSSTTDPM